VSFSWTPERALGSNSLSLSKSSANPLHNALSETLHTARQNANSLVLYAKQNPGLQRLVTGYEEWESNLRREASARLGGFQPLRQVFADNGLADDWGLLRRVKSSNSLYGGSLKRSASDNSLSSLSSAADGARKPAKQRVHLSADWDLFSALNSASAADIGNCRPPGPARHGLPRVATESSLDLDGTGAFANSEAARNLEAVAVTILQTSKQALANAQQSLQETATNCSQNLQSLTVLLQQNLPVQAPGVVQQIVRSSQSAQGSNALVPWSVLPRYLRAREFAAEMYDNQEEQKENYNILEQMQDYLDDLQVGARLPSGAPCSATLAYAAARRPACWEPALPGAVACTGSSGGSGEPGARCPGP
jgi:digalactosyldiacylglycerol synthase